MKIKPSFTPKELKELDDFFGPTSKNRPALYKSPPALRALPLARKARQIIDRLYRASLLPKPPIDPNFDWPLFYLKLFQNAQIQRDDIELLRYFYPFGPRFGP